MTVMTLKDWTAAQRGRSAAIAKACGVDSAAVANWQSGKLTIPLKHACTIEQISDGSVSVEVMVPKYAEQVAYLRVHGLRLVGG